MANRQSHPILAPSALRYDIGANLIGDIETPDSRNCSWQDGVIVKRPGYPRLGANLPLSGDVVGLHYFTLFSGTRYLIAATEDDLYKLNSTSERWEHITPSTVLETCDSGWSAGSGDTLVHDTTDKHMGTASMKLTLVAGRSDGDLLAYKDISSADISGHSHIGFWIKSSMALSAGDLEVVVSESNHAAGEKTGTYLETEITAIAADTWTFVRVAGTLTDFDAVISVSLFANASLTEALVLHLDDVRAYSPLTGDDDDFAEFAMIRDLTQTDQWAVISNRKALFKYTGSGQAEALISTYPAGVTSLYANHILAFKGHLHLFDVTENGNRYPTRARWSDTHDPADFLNGNASYQDLTGADWIQAAVLMGADHLCVLKSGSLWIGYATGDSDVFRFEVQVPGLGALAGRTAKWLRNGVVFLGWDDVYRFDGSSWESIGRPIRKELFRVLDVAQADRAYAVVHDERKEYWLVVPRVGNTYPDTAFVWNFELQRWTGRYEFPDYLCAASDYQRQDNVTIGDLVGTIGDQDWTFGDKIGTQEAPVLVVADTSGYVYQYDLRQYNDDADGDNTAIDGWFDTKDFMFTALKTRQLIVRLDVYHEPPSTLSVSYSTDQGAHWTSLGSGTATDGRTPTVFYVNVDCRMIRFRFRNNSNNERFAFREARITWEPAGERIV